MLYTLNMMMAKKSTAKKSTSEVKVPLCMPTELEHEIESTAAAVQLSKQDTMRHALRRGLPLLKRMFAQSSDDLLKLGS